MPEIKCYVIKKIVLIKIDKKYRVFYVSSTILSASAILTYIYLVLITTI